MSLRVELLVKWGGAHITGKVGLSYHTYHVYHTWASHITLIICITPGPLVSR